MVHETIYLDNHATTRVDPRVVATMLPYFSEHYGNASSTSHTYGRHCQQTVEAVRRSVADSIHAQPRDIVFTSGATESNNLAIRGVADQRRRRGQHIVSLRTEHKAILDPLARLARQGFEITLLDVAQQGSEQAGQVSPEQVADAIRDDTLLVTVMLANNEIGVLQPLAEIGSICRQRGVLLHTDATQAVGRIDLDVQDLQVDLLSFSAHKMYGPKGVGALYVRREGGRVRLASQIVGGGQEQGTRSGTLNVPGIVGLGAALELCLQESQTEPTRLAQMRNRLFAGLCQEIGDVQLNGPSLTLPHGRLAGNLNCSFPGVDGETIMMQTPEVAVSSGSACSSQNPNPSHVLQALGLNADRIRSSLRFGIGRFNTLEQIEVTIQAIARTVHALRGLDPNRC